VLYPHFQKAVVPGWLDKSLKWRHGATHFLDTMVVLAPDPDWVKTLPNGKLPDRTDFTHYGKIWQAASRPGTQLFCKLITINNINRWRAVSLGFLDGCRCECACCYEQTFMGTSNIAPRKSRTSPAATEPL
jgi:hypothetical protein